MPAFSVVPDRPARSSTAPVLPHYDVVVVGGGPAGTTAGHLLRKRGWTVLVIEKEAHPRFRIGESLLPHSSGVWTELGLWERFDGGPYARKYGAWFDFAAGDAPETFYFGLDNPKRGDWAWNVERAWFDNILWEAALDAGVQGIQHTEVTRFLQEGEGSAARISGVELRHADGRLQTVTARLTVDASGRLSLLGKQLGLRRPDPNLNMVALYAHFEDAKLVEGKDAGSIGIIAMPAGWAWAIPFAHRGMSLGFVMRNTDFAARIQGSDPATVFANYLAETPALQNRLGPEARLSRPVETTANFSFRCTHLAGEGWVLAGDAGAFVDPVFSSGVHLAMEGARRLSLAADHALKKGEGLVPASAFKPYIRDHRKALSVFTRFIYNWYDDTFRLAFLRPPPGNPLVQFIKRRILRVLAGDVFQPWRVVPWMWVLEQMARANAAGVRQLNGGVLPPPGVAPAVVPGRKAPPAAPSDASPPAPAPRA